MRHPLARGHWQAFGASFDGSSSKAASGRGGDGIRDLENPSSQFNQVRTSER
jgi:hypothetical protein